MTPTPAAPGVNVPTAIRAARPDVEDQQSTVAQRVLVGVFVGVPMLALLAAIPFAWGWGLGWHDVVIAAVFYWFTGLGVTVGYHRYFTHGSFKAKTGLPALVNTSLNVHEEPIVNRPEECLKTLEDGRVDFVVTPEALWTRRSPASVA